MIRNQDFEAGAKSQIQLDQMVQYMSYVAEKFTFLLIIETEVLEKKVGNIAEYSD